MNKFIIELKSEPDPLNSNETLVTDIVYVGEALDKEEKLAEAVEIFTEAMEDVGRISRKELQEQLEAEGVSNSTFGRVLKEMKEDGKISMEKSKTIKRGMDIVWLDSPEDGEVVYE